MNELTIYDYNTLFADKNFWNMSAENGEAIIIGVGGRKISEAETIKGAVEDAARRVSLFNQISATVTYTERIGDGFLDYFIDNQQNIVFNEDYLGYIDSLKYDPKTDVLITNNAAFVRTRWTLPTSFKVSYAPHNQGRPSWADNPPPTIGGMITGVGYSSPLMYHRAYIASYENAIYSIAIRVNGNVKAGKVNYQGEGAFEYSNSSESTMTASALIKGFYVLQVWIDPKTNGVYTLAIAQEASK
ncbi:MAG: hypothetical protein LBG05_04125 [Treponema sp.]|nr:hypothetical protein [Treponema sp.]